MSQKTLDDFRNSRGGAIAAGYSNPEATFIALISCGAIAGDTLDDSQAVESDLGRRLDECKTLGQIEDILKIL